MSLSNSQYDELLRRYDARQLYNQHIQLDRRNRLYRAYPRLKELEELTASASVRQAKKLLEGDDQALSQLRQELDSYRMQRKAILAEADIGRPFTSAPTAGTPDISAQNAAIVLNRQSLTWFIHSRT